MAVEQQVSGGSTKRQGTLRFVAATELHPQPVSAANELNAQILPLQEEGWEIDSAYLERQEPWFYGIAYLSKAR